MHCDCFVSIGKIEFPKQCEWEWIEEKVCPEVKSEIYDWECDLNNGETCPQWEVPEIKNIQEIEISEKKSDLTQAKQVTIGEILRQETTGSQNEGNKKYIFEILRHKRS